MADTPSTGFVPIPGSERKQLTDVEDAGPVEDSERIEVTLMTRRRAELPAHYSQGPATLTREDLAGGYGAHPDDIAAVRDVLARYGLQVTEADAGARRLTASGPASAFAAAFGASLRRVTSRDPGVGRPVTHRYRVGGLHLPAELDGIVTAVIGLDDRPQVSPHFRAAAASAVATSYTPTQVGAFYQFPGGTDGTGQVLAIIEFGGGFAPADLTTYFSGQGITAPPVTAVSVDGAVNSTGQNADGEVMLDIEVAGALAPKATQLVYFAPNSDQGFIDAVSTAVHASPAPTAISISWGGPEDSWSAQTRSALEQQFADACALGTTVCTAAGDNGAADGVSDGQLHCDYPASDPYVLSCGGTTLAGNTSTGSITSETVWNDGAGGGATGGGVSDVWPVPVFQAQVTMPAGRPAGRGVPDVAGNADPYTGYQVRVDGKNTVVGGTSAVAPLWAALICRLAQATGKRFGLINTLLYAGVTGNSVAPGFRDITSGGNNGYNAGPGWDACTGLGTPDGTALLTRLGPPASSSTS